MATFPDEMAQWRRRSEWIKSSFVSPSKRSKQQLEELLTLCNGDSRQGTITHWCTPGCCESDESCFQKVAECAVPLWTKGYPVPLLYRFKHYHVASSYIRTACVFFQLLPKVLEQMRANMLNKTDAASQLTTVVDALLQESAAANCGHFGDSADAQNDFQSRLDALLDNDLSYSLQNSLRKRLVIEEICKPQFAQSAVMIDLIVNSLEHGTNVFLQRTTWLTQISALGSHHEKYQELVDKSMQSFCRVMCGSLGKELICDTLGLLGGGLREAILMDAFDPSEERLTFFFKLVVVTATDLWRRMVYDISGYPFKLFGWLSPDQTQDEFMKSWNELMQTRPCCIDCEFTRVLLSEFSGCCGGSHKDAVLALLRHVASYSPTNSDTVEVKHGNMQWAVSKRSAQFVKKARSAMETSLLQSVVRQHSVVYNEVFGQTMPSRRTLAAVRRQVGVSSSNQHSKRSAEQMNAANDDEVG